MTDEKQHIGMTEAEIRAKHSEEVQHLHDKLREKDRELKEYRKAHGVLEHFFRQVRARVEPIKPLPMDYKPRQKSRVSTPIGAVAHSTDGHHGMIQEGSEIENFNAFSPEISTARQMGFIKEFLEWTELHRHNYTIDEMTHIVTGDMISGDIHQDLRCTNAWPSPVQAVEAGKLLAKQVALEAPHFKKVTVEFITADNHGRLTEKPQAREAGLNTLNYVVGEVAKAYLQDHKNVVFHLYPMHETVIHVHNRQYLICHGHDVRGWAGVPWYGLERKMGKESMARLQIIMQDLNKAKVVGFHRYIFGHWHTCIDLPLYMGTGSVSGTDAYDHQNGRYSEPKQSAWMVHPGYGEFDRINFNLTQFDKGA
jgi:hypothetical protein